LPQTSLNQDVRLWI